jgi:hypothetical protein
MRSKKFNLKALARRAFCWKQTIETGVLNSVIKNLKINV